MTLRHRSEPIPVEEARDERPLTPCGNIVCTGCRICGCPALGIAPQEARDDEREALALIIARTMDGWNDDTTEPEMGDPLMRRMAEEHWEKVNEECIRQGREFADAILAARFRKQTEPSWEYGVTTKWGMHEHPRLAGAQRYAKEVREEIEQGRASGDLAYHGRVMRRTKASAGPWVPVGEGEQ